MGTELSFYATELLTTNDRAVTQSNDIAEHFNDYFTLISNKLENTYTNNEEYS